MKYPAKIRQIFETGTGAGTGYWSRISGRIRIYDASDASFDIPNSDFILLYHI